MITICAALVSYNDMYPVFNHTEVLGIQVSIVLYVVGIVCICSNKR